MNKEIFINNRKNYFSKIENNSITVLFSGRNIQRTGDQDYDFEVDKNFYYLTGIKQDGVILVLTKCNNEEKAIFNYNENWEFYHSLADLLGDKSTVLECIDCIQEYVISKTNNYLSASQDSELPLLQSFLLSFRT